MAKANTVQVEVWVIVDEAGDYAVGTTVERAVADYEDQVQELNLVANRRVKVTLTVPLPEVIEVEADVTEDEPVVTVGAKAVA